MSRIKSSHQMFRDRKDSLSRRQPSGSVSKREYQAIKAKQAKKVGSFWDHNEILRDNIIYRKSKLCTFCGFRNRDENENCELCHKFTFDQIGYSLTESKFVDNSETYRTGEKQLIHLVDINFKGSAEIRGCGKPFYPNLPKPKLTKANFIQENGKVIDKIGRRFVDGKLITFETTDEKLAKLKFESAKFDYDNARCTCFDFLKVERRKRQSANAKLRRIKRESNTIEKRETCINKRYTIAKNEIIELTVTTNDKTQPKYIRRSAFNERKRLMQTHNITFEQLEKWL